MRTTLQKLLLKTVDLLSECGYSTQADWFHERLNVVRADAIDSDAFRQALAEINGIMGGMGSFSDLSLIPKEGSKLTLNEARNRQWELVEGIDAVLAQLAR